MRPGTEPIPDTVTSVPGAASPALELRDDASNLPHAAQLRRGFRNLRFDPGLELEFRNYYWNRYLFRTRIMLVAGAVLLSLFALKDFRTLPAEVWPVTVGIRMFLIVPGVLLGLALTYVKPLFRWIEAIIVGGVFIAMGGLTAVILVSERMGSPVPYEGLILIMVFVMFLSGLRFYKAGASTLATAAIFIVAGVVMGVPGPKLLLQSYYLVGITLIGLVGSYSLELSLRANFLTENVARFRALRDPLTQLYNRRAAMDHLERAWRLAFREREPLAVVMLDVDHFKKYNDRYGHVMGDGCLSEVAHALSDRVHRPMDIVTRYGGEEFMVVVYGAPPEILARLCEDLCGAVRNLPIAHADNPPLNRVTVSIGAATAFPAAGTVTLDVLIEQADQALYEAKRQGRNCVVMAGAG